MSLVPCHFIKFFTVASWILHILIAKASSELEDDEYPLPATFLLVSRLLSALSTASPQRALSNNLLQIIIIT